jgi:hypothetical protein
MNWKHLVGRVALILAIGAAIPAVGAATGGDVLPYRHDVLGVTLSHPSTFQIVEDEYLLDEYGFTLTTADPRKSGENDVGMVLRMVWLQGSTADGLDARVQEHIATFPQAGLKPSETVLDSRRAVVLENAPGLVTTTYVYLAANDRIYEIIYPQPTLDAQGQALLSSLRFETPSRSLESLNLKREPMVPMAKLSQSETHYGPVIEACVNYPTSKYLQTPITSAANGNGWTQAGPSYYGEGLHTGCSNTSSQNDNYALDTALRTWDPVLNPTNGGTVVWAGWASGGWSTLGRTVIIDQGGGYKSLSAHLAGINVSAGTAVNANSVIGYAGGSGNGVDGYWGSHLHQGLYLNASVSGGGTYGGSSAQQTNVHYCRNGCANYYALISKYQALSY